MEYSGTVTVAGTQCSVWNNTGNGFTWVNNQNPCLPISTQHDNDMMVFFDTTLGIENPAVFDLPSTCQPPHVKKSQRDHSLLSELLRNK